MHLHGIECSFVIGLLGQTERSSWAKLKGPVDL